MKTVLCITPNIALERTWVIPGLKLGGVFRVQQQVLLPSGKGLNVARSIQTVGGRVSCFGFLAGHTGKFVAQLAAEQGLSGNWTWIDGETRAAVAMLDPDAPATDATLISESGPQIDLGAWLKLEQALLQRDVAGHLAFFSGSFPPGTPFGRFRDLVRTLQTRGCPVWIDTSGPGLEAAVDSGAAGIKVNAGEAESVVRRAVSDPSSAAQAGAALIERGIGAAVVTLGAQGAVMVTPGRAWLAEPPAVRRVSSVGSGDAFLAGLLFGLAQELDPATCLRMGSAAGAANAQTLGGGRFKLMDYEAALGRVQVYQLT